MKNLTIKTRLVLSMAILASLLVGIGAGGIYSLGSTNAAFKTVYEDRLVAMGQLSTVIENLLRGQVRVVMASGASPESVAEDLEKAAKNMDAAKAQWDAYMQTHLTADEKELADRFAAAWQTYSKDGLVPTIAALKAQDMGAASKSFKNVKKLFVPVREGAKALMDLQLSVGQKEYMAAQSRYSVFRQTSFVAITIGLCIAVGMGMWLIRSIAKPLENAVSIARNVAAGNLTQRIDVTTTDETGQLLVALKDMNESLARIIKEVREGTDTIATASHEIASGNLDLSARTEQQASSLEETASAMEQLTATVKQNGESARNADSRAVSASSIASKGGEVVLQVVNTMGEISTSSKKIADIVGVIEGITFQTNILALNAAVEAARAGEQGRGFAVVASEVRQLAQRSAAAAKDIKALIETSVAQIDIGSVLAQEAGTIMKEVVSSVMHVTGLISEIAVAGEEQEAGIEQINTAIVEMDNVTQQNAALVEESAAAAASLNQQADTLQRLVSKFKLHRSHEQSDDYAVIS